MSKQMKAAIKMIKNMMTAAAEAFSPEERELFYNEISDWSYEQYEQALVCQEPEMQDYEAEGYPGIM